MANSRHNLNDESLYNGHGGITATIEWMKIPKLRGLSYKMYMADTCHNLRSESRFLKQAVTETFI
ncbi:hypothetical protein MTBBW1_1310064 [Desulfamplus magnetovallimortis]|uniref:Uncharacterized protein n=1 Tax=Desulfamplus magnetovallimortis TaxID=1246637 RepID=A0A1W1H7F9_9BACT|nr:hypothetical protein [Desulfamplus magnetovallimortis]SLM28366.1 hypothetical protein MTBBW1_1310064 [Desulfamplus magnetovallimortis]